MKLTEADYQKLNTKQVANVIRKLNAGKTLTAREQAILAQHRASEGELQTPGNLPPTGGYVATWDALADACGIDRRTLTNVRTRHAKDPDLPKDRADGRKCVADWLKFLADKGVEGRGINNPDIDYIDERQLRLRERQLAVETAEHKLKVQKRDVLALTEYQAALRITLGAFDSALQQIPGRCAEKLVIHTRQSFAAMLASQLTAKQFEKIRPIIESCEIDQASVIAILDAELEACRLALAGADFLQPDPIEDE